MSKNTLFAIAFGDYDLRIDRNTLRYRLEETATGTVWADGLGVGWIEFEDRLTGGLSRYDFGRATLVALSEKAGPRGKEILFGLECLGVPIDLYFTCAQREIRLTVEANRDGKTHRVTEVCLLPGLCAVPDDGVSHLVIPHHDGLILRPGDLPAESLPFDLPVWDAVRGLAMPFVGAVRVAAARDGGETDGGATTTTSALALGTDSAYAAAWLEPGAAGGGASLDFHYVRDPERRRLELRIWPLPRANHVGVARAHRDKVIATRQHVLLRRKARERPVVDAALLGGALIRLPIREAGAYVQSFADAAEIARDLRRDLGVERGLCLLEGWAGGPPPALLPAFVGAGGDSGLRQAADDIRALGLVAGLALDYGPAAAAAGALETAREDLPEIRRRFAPGALLLGRIGEEPLRDEPAGDVRPQTRWDDLDRRIEWIALAREGDVVVGTTGGADWSAIATDFCQGHYGPAGLPIRATARVPLQAVVYHDSVAAFAGEPLVPGAHERFLRRLVSLSPPTYRLDRAVYFGDGGGGGLREYVRRTYAVLGPLHRLCFPAFLTEHRFLTPDLAVEEARYSNGARVLVNRRGVEAFENDELALPPLGFLAEHAEMTAHDALRVRGESFPSRAWRVVCSRDGKPLAESADVERREFPV